MLCYIKDFKSFETIAKYDAVSYALPDGAEGSVVIYQKNPVELTQKYIGMWLLIADGVIPNSNIGSVLPGGGMGANYYQKSPKHRQFVYYISGCTPDEDSIELNIVHPIEAFEREVIYGGETTYGELIYDILTNDYGENCPDEEYAITCMDITNTDETECEVETDDYGYIVPKDYFEKARKVGVAINFTPTSDNRLQVEIKTANYPTGIVVIGDGHNQLESESYDASFCAKVTVIHDLGSIGEIEWKNGYVDNAGVYHASEDRLCTELYDVPARSTFTLEPVEDYKFVFVVYDENGTFVESFGWQEEIQKYYLEDASKVLFILAHVDDSVIDENDGNNLTVLLFVTYDYYLSEDKQVSSEPPENRAKGIWRVANANNNEDPEQIAIDIFNENTDNHKIEFYSDKYFEYGQPLSIRIRGEVVDTTVKSRVHKNSDSRYFYTCGNLATTLTDKIKKIEEAE